MDDSFARMVKTTGCEIPWEVLVRDLFGDGPATPPACDQVEADVDRLAQDLAAEFAALTGQP
jgi:hypothetical protein